MITTKRVITITFVAKPKKILIINDKFWWMPMDKDHERSCSCCPLSDSWISVEGIMSAKEANKLQSRLVHLIKSKGGTLVGS